ncbi:MAG TPA: hypothetical protein ENI42_00300 [Thermoplasmatales archaeon]|nr:hypothetical protein [Thermoplasmatales archaeon]
MDAKRKSVTCLLIVFLLILPVFTPTSSAFFHKKRVIKVAVILQHWDILDIIGYVLILPSYRKCLKEAEKWYNVKFELYKFWDNWRKGDVQNGKLEKLDIDAIVAPGGFGGWHTPEKYREEIKRFVSNGGGFYGICGDSTFGSMGVKNLPKTYGHLIKRLLGFKELSPMLGLANVYTDASVFKDMVGHPWRFTKLDLAVCLTQLLVSRAPVYFLPTDEPIQKPYFRKTIRMMLGNAPLVSGSKLRGFFMPDVVDIAVFLGSDKPYDKSLRFKKAIVATTYGNGRVILSAPHPELTIGKDKAHDIFIRNLLWVAKALPNT